MVLKDLHNVRALLAPLQGSLVGVGMTAFSRILPSCLLDAYQIVCLHQTADLPLLRTRAAVFCLEETGEGTAQGEAHSSALLRHERVGRILDSLPGPVRLLLYQNYRDLEALARNRGWVLLANPSALRLEVGHRAFFARLVHSLHLPPIPGGLHPVEALKDRPYKVWAADYGDPLVFQLPEILRGGGRGTFFVGSDPDYAAFLKRIEGNAWRSTSLSSVLIRKKIPGTPASMALCITRHGVLLSGPQRQLIDLPFCRGFEESGVFCGHEWGVTWGPKMDTEVRRQALVIGQALASLGYRGILGVDFVMDEEGQAVYPLEINPRLTGAFPMLSLLQLKAGLIPLEAFHLLEFLDLPYEMDLHETNDRYRMPFRGSHLLVLGTPPPDGQRPSRRPGLYQEDPSAQGFGFLGPAIDYGQLEGEDRFVLVDGPPLGRSSRDPGGDPFMKWCHLLFPGPSLDKDGHWRDLVRKAWSWVIGVNLSGKDAT